MRPGKAKIFSLFNIDIVQKGGGAQPASCPMGSDSYLPGVKRPELESDDSHPTTTEIKETRTRTFNCKHLFMTYLMR
jgi:hypothetical protein